MSLKNLDLDSRSGKSLILPSLTMRDFQSAFYLNIVRQTCIATLYMFFFTKSRIVSFLGALFAVENRLRVLKDHFF
jgi:hypothetical protein